MKRKELYAYIREQIINELSINEDATADKAAQDAEKTAIDKKIAALNKKKSELNKPESSLAETELEEMASYRFFRVADRAKFDALKDIYAGTVEEKILDAIATAGEQGITQANLASELQMASALINPILKKFGSINTSAKIVCAGNKPTIRQRLSVVRNCSSVNVQIPNRINFSGSVD